MNEEKLIKSAESGDVQAMLELANYYYAQSKSGNDDKVGDVLSTEDFFSLLNAEEKANPDLQAKAYKYFRMAADAGNVKAMTKVASWLYDGIGTSKNNEESQFFYRRAAELGDPDAMRVVAFTSNDDAEKFKYYKLSAELLEPSLNKKDSIKQTAINYACGRGTEKNLEEAEKWLAKLDEQGAASARLEISQITGESSWLEQAATISTVAMVKMAESFVKKNDFENALIWYEKASNSGDFESTSIIGDIYYIGEGNIPQDYVKALSYYEQAAAGGYNMAAVKQTLMIYRALGCQKDLKLAYRMFRRIVRQREKFFGVYRFNSVAKFYLAKMLENGEGHRKDLEKAFTWYKRAAAIERMSEYESTHEVPAALYKVADDYFMEQNFEKAIEIYTKLADSRSSSHFPYNLEAAKKLMWIYELGEGVPANKEKAAEWRAKIQNN